MREKERQRDAVCMFLPLCVAEPECMCVCETKKEQQREREKELSSSDMHSSSALQQDFSINIKPIVDRVAQNLEISCLKTFNLVPSVPGFSWNL